MGKSRNVIPEEFESIKQIQDFWDNHSTFDYWEEMEDIKMELSPTLRSKLELKKLYTLLGLSSEQIAVVENKAKLEDIDSRKLISKWILEHV